MIRSLRRQLGRLRRRLSRNESVVRWLGLSRCEGMAPEPGLIFVQIDGLSRMQFERALRKGRLPFLRKLLRKRGYQTHSMYSGLPSSTPAVQGEIFYGVRCAVPAFGYRDADTSRIVAMFDNAPAVKVQQRLERAGVGLLEGGSAYSNIYSGGATEPHFCASTFGWGVFRRVRPLVLLAIVLLHSWSIIRMLTLVLVEVFLALADAIHGQIHGHSLVRELKFVFARVGVSIALRELITIGASLDVTRGLPIVQLNFLGYDEQSHRRGPSSKFAHWSLKGIDDAIKRVWTAARRSQCRRYELWVYSDHGQTRTTQYSKKYGRTVQEAVGELFGEHVKSPALHDEPRGRRPSFRSQWLKHKNEGHLAVEEAAETVETDKVDDSPPVVEVVSLGPVGHVYPAMDLSTHQRETIAQALVAKCGIPVVVVRDGDGRAKAWTGRGEFMLPDHAEELFGEDHPFLPDLGEDLTCLAHHPNAGEFMILGWEPGGPAISFADENGSHAGTAPEETHGFLFLPGCAPLPNSKREYYRPSDLRSAVLSWFGSNGEVTDAVKKTAAASGKAAGPRTVSRSAENAIATHGAK